VTAGELSQRLKRADFLDGVGIYVGAHAVAMAHLRKRLFRVMVRGTRTVALPGVDQPDERRQALSRAVAEFTTAGGVDARRTVLCVPRSEAAFNRVILPAAARENLAQVLEYELENLIPLPREEIFYDFSVRDAGEDRIEVLLMCLPRQVAQGYLDALGQAAVRPRAVVLASTAIADFLVFCRGDGTSPLGLVVTVPDATEIALVRDGLLVSSQLLPARRFPDDAALERSVARQLAETALAAENVPLYCWGLANGAGPPPSALPGECDLLSLARGRLEAPEEFFASAEPAVLPAVGAALEAVREGTVPLNLLPAEERKGYDEGLSLATVLLVALSSLLLLVWGGSVLVKDALLRRQLQAQIETIEPQMRAVRKLQAEVDQLQKELDNLGESHEPQVTPLLRELTELIPTDAYLTGFNLRGQRLTIDGMARSASDLITALGKSKRFKNVNFASPTTKQGDKERFSIVAEVVR
jgi:general secretion pathway protein L